MFRKLTKRNNTPSRRLKSMGFHDSTQIKNALAVTGGDVDRAAELLLAGREEKEPFIGNNNREHIIAIQYAMQESIRTEEHRIYHQEQKEALLAIEVVMNNQANNNNNYFYDPYSLTKNDNLNETPIINQFAEWDNTNQIHTTEREIATTTPTTKKKENKYNIYVPSITKNDESKNITPNQFAEWSSNQFNTTERETTTPTTTPTTTKKKENNYNIYDPSITKNDESKNITPNQFAEWSSNQFNTTEREITTPTSKKKEKLNRITKNNRSSSRSRIKNNNDNNNDEWWNNNNTQEQQQMNIHTFQSSSEGDMDTTTIIKKSSTRRKKVSDKLPIGFLRFRQWEWENVENDQTQATKFTFDDSGCYKLYNNDYPLDDEEDQYYCPDNDGEVVGRQQQQHPLRRMLDQILLHIAPIYAEADQYEEQIYDGWLLPSRMKIITNIIQFIKNQTKGQFKVNDGNGYWIKVKRRKNYDEDTILREYIIDKLRKEIIMISKKKTKENYLIPSSERFIIHQGRSQSLDTEQQQQTLVEWKTVSVSLLLYSCVSFWFSLLDPCLLLNFLITPKECQKLIQLTHLPDGVYRTKKNCEFKVYRDMSYLEENSTSVKYYHIQSSYLAECLYNTIIKNVTYDYVHTIDRTTDKLIIVRSRVVSNLRRCRKILKDQILRYEVSGKRWYVTGIHPNFQLFQFHPGSNMNFFKESNTDNTLEEETENSETTMYIYLNTGFEGDGNIELVCSASDGKCIDRVPFFQTGSVLLLRSGIYPRINKIKSGCLYVLRANLVYSPQRSTSTSSKKKKIHPRESCYSKIVVPQLEQRIGDWDIFVSKSV